MSNTKRTQKEILDRIKVSDDFLGTQLGDLCEFLEFENAKPFLREDYIKKVESGEEKWVTKNDAEKEIKEYMDFAWEKANNCRSISAGKSILHFKSWLWLDGKDKLSKQIEEYNYYGKPQLVAICREYGIDWKQYDNGICQQYEDDSGIPTESIVGE